LAKNLNNAAAAHSEGKLHKEKQLKGFGITFGSPCITWVKAFVISVLGRRKTTTGIRNVYRNKTAVDNFWNTLYNVGQSICIKFTRQNENIYRD
jgi:hypothetical protein